MQKSQEITLIPFNAQEALDKLYTACRTCYMAGTPQAQYEKCATTDSEKKWKLIKHVLDSGHFSVLEHVTFTFLVSNVSRALSHQLIRHRIGVAYSQQSQRYCTFKNGFDYIIPNKIEKDEETRDLFHETMNKLNEVYLTLIDKGIPAEDARAVLPNACCTNLTCTMNLRELIHFCNERMCTCAQQEIRQMARTMAKLVSDKLPELKPYLKEKCASLGYCNENKDRTCGKKPLKENFLKVVDK